MTHALIVLVPPTILAVAILADLWLEQRRRRRLYLQPPEKTVTLAGPPRHSHHKVLGRIR